MGRIGAEVQSTCMDRCFTGLIDAVAPFGGDVLFFGGDALFVAFFGHRHEQRAVDGAGAMLRALRDMVPLATSVGPIRIGMSVGVASGAADVIVGDGPQWPLFVVGPTVSRTVRLEARADAAEIRIDAATAAALPISERRMIADDEFVVTRRRRRPPPGQVSTGDDRGPHSPLSERHLPSALRARLLAGDAPKEHRHVTVAFIRFRDLDRLPSIDRARLLLRASTVVGEACEALDVCVVETDVADDGATIVLAGGVPRQRDDDELRVVAAARRVVDSEIGDLIGVGVHRGTAFVGDIGHARRRTYAVTGLTTITAARLAGAASRRGVLASADVIDRLQQRYRTGSELRVVVKGRRDPVRAATVLGLAAPGPTGGRRRARLELIGRRRELAALQQALRAHRAGHGSVVEVVGPPGIGKTELVRAFLASAPPPRMLVEGELALSTVPFGVFVPALRAALGAADSDGVWRLVEAAGEQAALIGPVLGIDVRPTDAAAAIEPASLPHARAELVCRLLREPAGVFVVEDAHWLDAATLELLGAIVGRLATDGWLVVVVRRADTPSLGSAAVLVEVQPLTDGQVERLAVASGDHALSDVVLDAIVRRAGGNPLFAVQLARSRAAPADIGLPESAERVVGARIDLLPADLRARLRRASVLGGAMELDVLQEVLDDPAVKSEDAWVELDDFVRWSPTHVEFRHDLFRLAAYEGLSFAERSNLHRRAGELLEQRPDTPPAVLAEHARAAGRPADVVRWATRAADDAAAGAAFADEVRLRRLAAESAKPAGVVGDERAHLYLTLAQGYELLGEVDAAEHAYAQAMASAAPRARGAIRLRQAWLAFRNDDLPRARRRVAAGLRHLPPDESAAALRVELTVLHAAIRGAAGDRRGSDDDARWAVAEAQRLRSDELRGHALMQLAFNADVSDDADADELRAAAVPLLERAGRRRDVAILHLNRGVTHMVRGRWPAALDAFERAADGFRRCGYVLGSLTTDANRGGLLLEQGHPERAAELFDDVVRRAVAAGNTRLALFAGASAHRARAWTGATEGAHRGLVECIQAHHDAGLTTEAETLGAYLVEVLVLAGHFDEAGAHASVVLGRLEALESEVIVLSTRRLAAVAKHLAGDPDALDELRAVLAAARADDCSIEIARCLQALELCAPELAPTCATERERRCRDLGVTWMPPVTFALPPP